METVPDQEHVCVITQRLAVVVVTVLVAPNNQIAAIMEHAQVDKRHIIFCLSLQEKLNWGIQQ